MRGSGWQEGSSRACIHQTRVFFSHFCIPDMCVCVCMCVWRRREASGSMRSAERDKRGKVLERRRGGSKRERRATGGWER